jgi:glycosyltransferase involved in cell wall biosynthesis
MPKISVIVPVYKAEQYLHDCIDSILSQTYTDYEVILVEDGSPDDCGRICEAFAAKYDCISVIHQENRGQAAARNHAMQFAKGDWICFVDSDDLIHPQMLELLYEAAVSGSAPISMCQMLEAETLPEDFCNPLEAKFEELTMDEQTLLRLHDADAYPAWVACAKLIRRDLVTSYPFREGRVFEDNEAVCHWVCGGKKLATMDHKLYFYRTNQGSTTKSSFSMKKLDYLWALESIIRYYDSVGFTRLRSRFADRYIEAVISGCNGVRYILGQEAAVRTIEKQYRKFAREQKLKLSQAQFEALLDVTHPKLIKAYWPVAGAVRTIRQQGIAGMAKKIKKHLGKGEQE